MASEKGATVKTCRICGTEKPVSEFYFRKDSGNYRSECKDCLILIAKYRTFGVCATDYAEMLAKQQGQCAICGSLLDCSRYTKLAIDHDHKTGKVRGLLCTNCNTALGLMKDSPIRLRAAAAYLER